MRIAIHSLPRSGTKSLQINFHRWLLSTQDNVLCPNAWAGLGEPFNFNDDEFYNGTRKIIYAFTNTELIFSSDAANPLKPITTELGDRINILLRMPNSWVFKRFILYKNDPILYDTIVNVDRCIAVKRNDLFNHLISFVVAKKLEIWSLHQGLADAVERHKNNKIVIDLEKFANAFEWFKGFYNFKWSKDFQIVNFDQMVKISSAKEFCEYFDLEYKEFEFHPFAIEYGNDKFDMIANLEELKELYDRLENKFKSWQ